MFAPPPQPMSRIRASGLRERWELPHTANGAWKRFMPHSLSLPPKPGGLARVLQQFPKHGSLSSRQAGATVSPVLPHERNARSQAQAEVPAFLLAGIFYD